MKHFMIWACLSFVGLLAVPLVVPRSLWSVATLMGAWVGIGLAILVPYLCLIFAVRIWRIVRKAAAPDPAPLEAVPQARGYRYLTSD